jgi:hypothetical protein
VQESTRHGRCVRMVRTIIGADVTFVFTPSACRIPEQQQWYLEDKPGHVTHKGTKEGTANSVYYVMFKVIIALAAGSCDDGCLCVRVCSVRGSSSFACGNFEICPVHMGLSGRG